jgi:hypothetical protein
MLLTCVLFLVERGSVFIQLHLDISGELNRSDSHKTASPNNAASFKSLYLDRLTQSCPTALAIDGPDTALRLCGSIGF